MGTSWVAVSINNITTRASREMMSRKNIKIVYLNGVNVAKHWHVAGEVFAISDCLVGHRLWPVIYLVDIVAVLKPVFKGHSNEKTPSVQVTCSQNGVVSSLVKEPTCNTCHI